MTPSISPGERCTALHTPARSPRSPHDIQALACRPPAGGTSKFARAVLDKESPGEDPKGAEIIHTHTQPHEEKAAQGPSHKYPKASSQHDVHHIRWVSTHFRTASGLPARQVAGKCSLPRSPRAAGQPPRESATDWNLRRQPVSAANSGTPESRFPTAPAHA